MQKINVEFRCENVLLERSLSELTENNILVLFYYVRFLTIHDQKQWIEKNVNNLFASELQKIRHNKLGRK